MSANPKLLEFLTLSEDEKLRLLCLELSIECRDDSDSADTITEQAEEFRKFIKDGAPQDTSEE